MKRITFSSLFISWNFMIWKSKIWIEIFDKRRSNRLLRLLRKTRRSYPYRVPKDLTIIGIKSTGTHKGTPWRTIWKDNLKDLKVSNNSNRRFSFCFVSNQRFDKLVSNQRKECFDKASLIVSNLVSNQRFETSLSNLWFETKQNETTRLYNKNEKIEESKRL